MSADTQKNTQVGIPENEAPAATERFLTFTCDGLNIGVSTN